MSEFKQVGGLGRALVSLTTDAVEELQRPLIKAITGEHKDTPEEVLKKLKTTPKEIERIKTKMEKSALLVAIESKLQKKAAGMANMTDGTDTSPGAMPQNIPAGPGPVEQQMVGAEEAQEMPQEGAEGAEGVEGMATEPDEYEQTLGTLEPAEKIALAMRLLSDIADLLHASQQVHQMLEPHDPESAEVPMSEEGLQQ